MAYKIVYGQDKRQKPYPTSSGLRLQAMTAAFLLIFTLGVRQLWPEGAEKLREHLLPDPQNTTQAAFENLAGSLSSGNSFEEAITTFCREIMDDAQTSEESFD